MSYCRFSSGDVYMYASSSGGIECCACNLADKVPTIFTTGTDEKHIFKNIKPCGFCKGVGCNHCMMNGNTLLETYEEAIIHLENHVKMGDSVPEYAFESLKDDLQRGEPLVKIINKKDVKKVKKIEENMDNFSKIAQINRYQNSMSVHPLTCGFCDERKDLLQPAIKDDQVVLFCPTCKSIQKDVPGIVYEIDIDIMEGNFDKFSKDE